MTTLWIVVGLVGYLAVGVAVARSFSTARDNEVDRGIYALAWPLVVVVVVPMGILVVIGRLAGGK